MIPTEDPHLAVGAYVLHALPPSEEAAFENHLAGCEACAQERADLAATAARLAAAEPVAPPAALRQRVLETIATTRQEHHSRRAAPSRHRGMKLVLAACLAAAAALGGITVWQTQEAGDARARMAEVESQASGLTDVLSAPDATIRTQQLPDGATAGVVASRTQRQAALIAVGLPPLTNSQVYEIWYAEAGKMRPAGLLPGSGGRQTHLLAGQLDGATAVGITVEPAGGSEQPTTSPLGLIPIPA
ncbi:anti-sigma factor [Streptomyces sp. NPDC017993]|uniref:anti-sigma factor n=1 Tax=Streptomyces sp. NPDC017993 TaxID=3365027 RepID=UPI0037A546AE